LQTAPIVIDLRGRPSSAPCISMSRSSTVIVPGTSA
jgi:hypothetical protein